MIYDCFTFFNELDLLEVRFNELYGYVDKFVIVEATETFTGNPKPLYFKENKDRYSKFLDKVIHVVLDDYSDVPDFNDYPAYRNNEHVRHIFNLNPHTWQREIMQRNAIAKGLYDCKKEDIIIIGDADEIPNLKDFGKYKNFEGVLGFFQRYYYYYLNLKVNQDAVVSKAIHFGDFVRAQDIRHTPANTVIEDGGWHFSFLGEIESKILKINSTAHQEVNTSDYNNVESIKFNLDNNLDIFGRSVDYEVQKLDNTFPQYVLKNKKRFKQYIKEPNKKPKYPISRYRQEIIKERKKSEALTEQIYNLKQELSKLQI